MEGTREVGKQRAGRHLCKGKTGVRKRKVGIGVTADPGGSLKALGSECENLKEEGGWDDG